MSFEISRETEARLTEEAHRQGISVDALLDRYLNDLAVESHDPGNVAPPEVPLWHLGGAVALHRRDLYKDLN